jgi:thymidine phosphorylase
VGQADGIAAVDVHSIGGVCDVVALARQGQIKLFVAEDKDVARGE